jgi:hypothetical protein
MTLLRFALRQHQQNDCAWNWSRIFVTTFDSSEARIKIGWDVYSSLIKKCLFSEKKNFTDSSIQAIRVRFLRR